jgi:hypothetical protein
MLLYVEIILLEPGGERLGAGEIGLRARIIPYLGDGFFWREYTTLVGTCVLFAFAGENTIVGVLLFLYSVATLVQSGGADKSDGSVEVSAVSVILEIFSAFRPLVVIKISVVGRLAGLDEV